MTDENSTKGQFNYMTALLPFLEKDRSYQADLATTLGPDDEVLKSAFFKHKLDPDNPWHWRWMLEGYIRKRTLDHPQKSEQEKDYDAKLLLSLEARARSEKAEERKRKGGSIHFQRKLTYREVINHLKKTLPTEKQVPSLYPARFSDARKRLKERGLMTEFVALLKEHGFSLPDV